LFNNFRYLLGDAMAIRQITYQTFFVSLTLFLVYLLVHNWFGVLCLFIGLVNILGWMMDKYFVKKYNKEVLPYAKDIGLTTMTKEEKKGIPFYKHIEIIKGWWKRWK